MKRKFKENDIAVTTCGDWLPFKWRGVEVKIVEFIRTNVWINYYKVEGLNGRVKGLQRKFKSSELFLAPLI